MQDKKTVAKPLPDAQQAALTLIYELYYKQMYQKAYDILRNPQDAEDAVQEAFYRVCLNAKDFSQPHSQSTAALIHTYTKNVAINHYHKKKRQLSLIAEQEQMDDVPESKESDPAEQMERQEIAVRLDAAVDALEQRYREVIRLKYYEHKHNKEIAEMLGLSQSVVNGRVFRAKRALRKILESREGGKTCRTIRS
ncbi:MAG: RNA polymerase sigma factor [Ruminococcaceae bacterium]|nr:RNA polymerase sigma factor [Oscillospiraceae bacterium]